jgi:glycosyltransferase involved in cell wall biosynthesis
MGNRQGLDPVSLDMPLTGRGISVLLPAHNEQAVIADTVTRCAETLRVVAPDYEIIVIDDGSGDRTGEIADALASERPRTRVVHNHPQRGYGGALQAGFQAASKPLVFFMDADGQFDIRDIAWPLQLSKYGYLAVLGYRRERHDPPVRVVNAWGWNTLVSLLFHLQVRDVDCAFKLYSTSLVQALDIRSEGATVNAEMLVKLARLGVRFVEVPVRHYPRLHGKSTGANIRVILRAFRELFQLYWNLRDWKPQAPADTSGIERPPDNAGAPG